jgi:hypothetical protein
MASSGVVKGTDGRVLIGCNFNYNGGAATIVANTGTKINADTWKLAGKADDIPAVGFEDVAYDGNVYDAGNTSLIYGDITFSGYWDFNQNPHTNPPNLRIGAVLGNPNPLTGNAGLSNGGVALYVSKNNNKYFVFQSIRILALDVGGNLKTRVDLNVSAKSNGTIWYPQ